MKFKLTNKPDRTLKKHKLFIVKTNQYRKARYLVVAATAEKASKGKALLTSVVEVDRVEHRFYMSIPGRGRYISPIPGRGRYISLSAKNILERCIPLVGGYGTIASVKENQMAWDCFYEI